ncbi:CFI-box-CTERM domain-containing protein [Nodularia harveyana UHCC-0300]|uniref:CFI-box-CTERM domain-containing protein n=1 Tax=Nodularia harveyana UHCC-0300 TaxID=2974287 RepID=A0ABU5UC87_9CYAN|nr:CFI-box-CTERM domain-containing protein [Nodularia harveyana]MEA5580581.1 CFI-box-CTERM domain-containing protein [Nodularia harveyana UHCC-0300]
MSGSFTEKMIQTSTQDYKLHIGRGDFYVEEDNPQKAFKEYIDAMYHLRELLFYANILERDNPSTDTQIFSLTSLTRTLIKILRCYLEITLEHRKFLFLLWYMKDTYTALGKLEAYFDVDILKLYQSSGEEIDRYFKDPNLGETVEVLVQRISGLASTKEGLAEIDNGDEDFKKLRENLEEICALEICPVRPKSINYSSKSSDGCFIATAAYSTPFHPDLDTFRSFRDRKLRSNLLGKGFIALYYKFSPTIAEYLNKNLLLKGFIRRRLEHLAAWMRKHEN